MMPVSKTGGRTVATLRSVHRTMAAVVIIFAMAHMANHFAGLVSVASHLHLMEQLRTVYRRPAIEAALLAGIAVHTASGLLLLHKVGKKRSGGVAWLQAASGAYLALFLLIHVAAVLFGRLALGLDTNFYFAAAGLHVRPFNYFFAPYYFFAVLALFVHVGCALARPFNRTSRLRIVMVALFMGIGTVASTLILASLMGLISEYDIPQKYMDTFRTSSHGQRNV